MRGQLTLQDMPSPLIKVTPARLGTWDDCRRRYRMTYLDRPSPPRGGAWAHATLGAVVHNALRAFFELPVARRGSERAAALVERHWTSEGVRDADPAGTARARGRGAARGGALVGRARRRDRRRGPRRPDRRGGRRGRVPRGRRRRLQD